MSCYRASRFLDARCSSSCPLPRRFVWLRVPCAVAERQVLKCPGSGVGSVYSRRRVLVPVEMARLVAAAGRTTPQFLVSKEFRQLRFQSSPRVLQLLLPQHRAAAATAAAMNGSFSLVSRPCLAAAATHHARRMMRSCSGAVPAGVGARAALRSPATSAAADRITQPQHRSHVTLTASCAMSAARRGAGSEACAPSPFATHHRGGRGFSVATQAKKGGFMAELEVIEVGPG